MPDPETPPEPTGQEPVGTPSEPPESPQLPESTPPEPPAEQPPTEQPPASPEDQLLHKMQSWAGRRDAELRAEMERRDQALLGQIGTLLSPQTPGSPEPAEAPDPTVDANAWFEHKLKEKEQAMQQYNESLINTGVAIIDADELVKADPTLRDDIIQEIQSGRVPINRMLDARVAADVAIAKAKSNILTRRLTKKANPLDGNTPSSTPKGGVSPPAAPPTPTVKVPEMSELAKNMATQWGYKDEEIAEILKE